MPELMASHWNTAGEVDGYMSRFWGVFLMPIISLAVFGLMIFLPRIDPLKQNVDKFKGYYDGFILTLFLFLFYIYGLTLAWNLGYRFPMGAILLPAFACLFFYIGVMLAKSKRNWFIGIKTPWTLSSEEVWDKTHRLGATLFKLAGVLALIGLLLPDYAFWFILVPILLFTLVLFAYSYIIFKGISENNNNNNKNKIVKHGKKK